MDLQPGDRAILQGSVPAIEVLILAMTVNKHYLILTSWGYFIVDGTFLTWHKTQCT